MVRAPRSGALGLMFAASVILAAVPTYAQSAGEDADREGAAPAPTTPPQRPDPRDRTVPPAAPSPPPPDLDEVTLRDGRRLRGRIVVREPGRWVVIETEDGRRRTLPWDRVEEIDVAARATGASVWGAAEGAWQRRAGGAMSFELRAIVVGAVLPRESFGLTGNCATGSGHAPASIYGQTASDRARGAGVGAGGRASYMYMSTLDPRSNSTWWGLRLGLGLDMQVLYTDAPTGIAPKDGELCSAVSKTAHTVEHEGRPLLMATIPLHLGAHFAFGSFEDWSWRGFVLGAAWAPSSIHVGLLTDSGSSHFNYLGFELTLDVTTLHAQIPRGRPSAHTRLTAFISIPQDPAHPLVGTLGIGAAWY